MTPRQKRKYLDMAISFPLYLVAASFVGWWAPFVLAAFGIWNYWDGMTRSNLSDKTSNTQISSHIGESHGS